MLRNLLGAAAITAIACAFVPAHAAKVGVGCSGEKLARAEGAVETMVDGPSKSVAEREMAQAQDALLSGTMRGCAMHLSRAMHAGALAQVPEPGMMVPPSPAGTMGQAPSQPQWGWQPIQSAQ